jgi:hypothetical protein
MTAGYSGTPLAEKLGIKPGQVVAIINNPGNFADLVAPLPPVREMALPEGLVDVKVCAIDSTWSGLKIVWRKELR